MTIHLYSGAGNSFVVLDGRTPFDERPNITELCRRFSTDGLMILRSEDKPYDFAMEYFNSDGSGGMMCGNGGRCIVAFADFLGIKPGEEGVYKFLAPDGEHEAVILRKDGKNKTVKLKMCDVHEFAPSIEDGYFLNTGTRHFVKFCDDIEKIDIVKEGARLRHHPAFAPIGVNANFVQILDNNVIKVRTFEKGVEAETLACGTGVVASAIATFLSGKAESKVHIYTRQDELDVEFKADSQCFKEVYLTGPTVKL